MIVDAGQSSFRSYMTTAASDQSAPFGGGIRPRGCPGSVPEPARRDALPGGKYFESHGPQRRRTCVKSAIRG